VRLGFAFAKPCPVLGTKPTGDPVNKYYEKALARTENILTMLTSQKKRGFLRIHEADH
jgi:hypothetical protein